jgi:hypothetical protein
MPRSRSKAMGASWVVQSDPSYEEWSRLLADTFFSVAEESRPVYFAVDDDILDELVEADRKGSGARSLVQAVRPRLNIWDPARLFDPLANEAYAWAGSRPRSPIPPFLAGLAVTVLAASRMDDGDGISATNYYARLREVLDTPNLPGSAFRETIPSVFRIFREWIDGQPRHRRGTSTVPVVAQPEPVPVVAQPEHVGFPLSQVQFRESDRRKLTSFFRQLRLKATDSANAEMLLAPAREWAGRSGLSPGARRLLRPGNDRAAIALIASELSRWDESERDERGRRVGQIRLTLQVLGQPRWGMLATRPDGFPSAADFEFDRWQQRLVSSIDGFYDPVSFSGTGDPLLASLLSGAVSLRCPYGTLRFSAGSVIPLGPDLTVGALASRRRIEPGERFSVLVRPDKEAAVTQLLDGHAREGWNPRPTMSPPGWLLISDVFVDLPPTNVVDVALRPLVPSVDARPELVGGLQLRGHGRDRVFLTNGEPDLWVPDWLSGQPAVTASIDSRQMDWGPSRSRVALSSMSLEAGTHAVTMGPYDLRFRSVATRVPTPIPQERVCRVTLHIPRGSQVGGAPADSVDVCGATLVGSSERGDGAPAPIHVPYGARRYVGVGSATSMAQDFPEPDRPAWLTETGLIPRTFEVFSRPGLAWILVEWKYRGWSVIPVSDTMPSRALTPSAIDQEWATVVSAAADAGPETGLWSAYVQLAREIADG